MCRYPDGPCSNCGEVNHGLGCSNCDQLQRFGFADADGGGD